MCPIKYLLIHGAMFPEEKLTGATPMINNLRIFGCHAYAWVVRCYRRKLESTSTPCIYLGPERGGHAHRLWNPST